MLNVLSLFDGMSCGQLALRKAGITYGNYYASEIDKFAIKITQKNFPSTIHLGDVVNWRSWDIPWASIELIFAGSPCQGFSFIGKNLSFEDPRSKLFFVAVEILQHVKKYNPNVKFLVENVRMTAVNANVFTSMLQVQPYVVNSELVSAQLRERWYWFNWSVDNIDWPCKGPTVLEVLGTDELYVRSHGEMKRRTNGKTTCIDANYHKGMDNHGQRTFVLQDGAYRKLDPEECELLQTVPLGYTAGVSNTQRYKMLGNGWTVDVVANLLKHLPRT